MILDLHWLPIFYQIIHVNSTNAPCFLNYTAGADMWRQYGFDKDYIKASLGPWQWITDGWFSMILVSVLVGMTYLKYHKAIYALLIGSVFLPISYGLFPEVFLSWAIIMEIGR